MAISTWEGFDPNESSRLVEALVENAAKHAGERLDVAIALVQMAATVARRCFTGWYTLGSIEQLLCELGLRLEAGTEHSSGRLEPSGAKSASTDRMRILHVITRGFSAGGHTRLVENWIRLDTINAHDLLITDPDTPLPEGGLSEAVRAAGGAIVQPRGSALHRAWELRREARKADMVVVSAHEDDVVPGIALAPGTKRPPVVVVNHADHAFWVGSAAADCVTSIRPSGSLLAAGCRGLPKELTAEMPIPVMAPPALPSRRAARTALGLDGDGILLATMAQAYKYETLDGQDLPTLLDGVLGEGVSVVVIGPTPAHEPWGAAARRHPDHVSVIGIQPNPELYLAAADVYLDSFPAPSLTSALQAAAAGLPVISMALPEATWPPTAMEDDRALVNVVFHDADSYRSRLTELIASESERSEAARTLMAEVGRVHIHQSWPQIFSRMYAQARAARALPAEARRLLPRRADQREFTVQRFLARHELERGFRYRPEDSDMDSEATAVHQQLTRIDELILRPSRPGAAAFREALQLARATEPVPH